MTKAQLRKIFIQKRNELSQAEYDGFNHALLQQFQQLALSGISCIHLFLPIHQRREPDTFLIRNWLAAHHPHIVRVFPKANFGDSTMINYADDDELELAVNAFGIPEPVSGNLLEIAQIDLVLVPLLAFDTKGYRVGYGKGFYDRFMAQCRADARFIGLSFFDAVEKISDLNEFDRPVQQCITPNGIVKF
ncbi:5-formyltetrahydrofolate cyclo-ligase [Mucilaginibacter terrae]|uniref:5-formyltetrahydrofolate cyclo-ligase n=1 Tax=Mucilaginibacter terrae TaxID=1955052 RepID=A0ABU3GUM3_9SPHI|nr:5-formyltetrahydrofolate cyclo-ligase [Mucilaginibacter terrae]MDT3403473.1 5-formyltetrahydrofolate cyclo-ligase [Mucilaginibacter terrae]